MRKGLSLELLAHHVGLHPGIFAESFLYPLVLHLVSVLDLLFIFVCPLGSYADLKAFPEFHPDYCGLLWV